jgi:mRNA interferase RelE/StbE
MKVSYTALFSKDLDKINDDDVLEKIELTIEQVKSVQKPTEIQHIKKMKNAKNAFRIRVGNYRIGIYILKDTVIFTRVALRKDIYDIFP